MVRVDMTAPEPAAAPEGTYAAEVTSSESTTSGGGDPMLKIKLDCSRPEGASFVIRDTIMLAGNGWGIGRAKLTALGVAENFQGELDPISLMNKQIFVHLKNEEWTGRDGVKKTSLKPDITQGTHRGYSLHTDEAAKASAGVGDADEAPF